MLSVTRLLCGTATPGDALRYGRHSSKLPAHLLHFAEDKKPVVVWNCTGDATSSASTAMPAPKTRISPVS